ncbi:MAG: alpha/beta fold hydrolase [Pseudomonadota bacterium]
MIPAVRRLGEGGPTLVCHPGGPGYSAGFLGDLAGLGDSLELLLVDPRGTGATPRPDDPRAYATEDYVADLDELRAGLGLERMDLLGFSHGGVVAMAYAARHPHRVARLVLVATIARFAPEQEDAMHAAMAARSGEPWFAEAAAALEAEQHGGPFSDEELSAICEREFPLYFARYGGREAAFLASVRETVNADALTLWNAETFATFDLRPELAGIEAPTLVLAGSDDFICSPAAAAEIAGAIPHARLEVVAGAGHFVFVEQPDPFRAALLGFLAESADEVPHA